MLKYAGPANRRCAALITLGALAALLAGCGKSRSDQDPHAKGPVVTCNLRCEWTAEGLMANLAFQNVSDGEVAILQRNLLIGDDAGELTWSPFEITRRGARIPYNGKVVKQPAPTNADYRVLAPGEVVNATVNVGSAYDVSPPGVYRVRYASVNFSRDGNERIDIASNTVEVLNSASR
ncbi:MAG TPA: hypothetical protein VEI07_15655 [Planctomycetaceae bacterium]|nr:hypothetical protein [Planctomycetaceae bacterium]